MRPYIYTRYFCRVKTVQKQIYVHIPGSYLKFPSYQLTEKLPKSFGGTKIRNITMYKKVFRMREKEGGGGKGMYNKICN